MTRMLLAGALVLAACDLGYQPEVGALLPTAGIPDSGPAPGDDGGAMTEVGGPCSDSDPEVYVSFAEDVRPLTFKAMGGCGCHSSSASSGFNLGTYDRLRRGGLNSGQEIVVPGNPCDSILVQKLGLAPPFGSRMPYNGPPFFTAEEMTVIKDWIAEGARNN
jgi:hypothetical protein